MVIPGIELACHNGVHVLLHFSEINEYKKFYSNEIKGRVKKNPWFLEIDHNQVIDIANKYNCLITLPHPYGPGLCGIQKFAYTNKIISKVDAIEVLNGCCEKNMNLKAIAWAKIIRKGFIGGSDGHCLAEHGTSLTICKAKTRKEFLEEIRKNRSLVIGKQERILEDAVNALHKFFREEKKAPKKQVEMIWKGRLLLEWDYFKKRIQQKHFFNHYHAHHQNLKKKYIKTNEHTKHLASYMK